MMMAGSISRIDVNAAMQERKNLREANRMFNGKNKCDKCDKEAKYFIYEPTESGKVGRHLCDEHERQVAKGNINRSKGVR